MYTNKLININNKPSRINSFTILLNTAFLILNIIDSFEYKYFCIRFRVLVIFYMHVFSSFYKLKS